jgi:hypothetical protein
MGLRYLKDYDSFINESKKQLFEAADLMTKVDGYFPKLSKAADLIAAMVNRETGNGYMKFPFVVTKTIQGKDTDGVMFYANKGTSAFRVTPPIASRGAIVGGLEYYEDHAADVATYIMTSEQFPITKLVGEFILIISNPAYAKTIFENEDMDNLLYEAKSSLTPNEVREIESMLDAGKSVRDISKQLGVPRRLIYDFKEGVVATEKESPVEQKNTMTLQDKVQYLEETLQDIYDITGRIAANAPGMNSLFISGKAGTGKTYNVEKALKDEGLTAEVDYTIISGAVSAIQMYKKFFQYNDKIVVFDDCDAVFRDENGRNLLKAALDTKKVRKISYQKRMKGELYDPKIYEDDPDGELEAQENGEFPSYFNFTGKVIFISNLPKDKADPDGAIRSRSILVDVSPDDATLVERMRVLLPKLEPMELSLADKEEIFEFMKDSKSVSMRTFVKAAGFKLGGLANWKRMAERYV